MHFIYKKCWRFQERSVTSWSVLRACIKFQGQKVSIGQKSWIQIMPTIFGCTNTTLLIWRTTFQISLVPLYLNWNTCYVCAKQDIKIQIGWDNPNPLTEVFWHTIFIIYTVPVTCYAGLWMRPSDLGFNRVRKNCLLSTKKIACKKCDVSSQMVSSSDSNPSFDFVRFYFIPDPGKFRHSFIHSKLHLASIWDASQIANFLLLQFQIRTTSEGLITSGNCGTIFFNHQSLGHISCKWLIPRQPPSASIHSSNGLKISKYNLIRNQRPDDSIRNPLNWITSVLSINFVWYRKTHKKSQKKKKTNNSWLSFKHKYTYALLKLHFVYKYKSWIFSNLCF